MQNLKSILIIGAKDSGKSTTIQEVCKLLDPQEIIRLDIRGEKFLTKIGDIYNGTYILALNARTILVVAGTPTEQNWKLIEILESCVKRNIEIDLLIVSKRTFEKKFKFDTISDVKKNSNLIHTEKINLVPKIFQDDIHSYRLNSIWLQRVDRILKIILDNI